LKKVFAGALDSGKEGCGKKMVLAMAHAGIEQRPGLLQGGRKVLGEDAKAPMEQELVVASGRDCSGCPIGSEHEGLHWLEIRKKKKSWGAGTTDVRAGRGSLYPNKRERE